MTDPAGGSTPPPSPGWQAPSTQSGGLSTAPIAAGPAPGVAYADLVTRVIAYIIDAIILGIVIGFIAAAIVAAIIGSIIATGSGTFGIVGFVLLTLISLGGSALYFIYTWTTMRASLGQRVLGLETVNAADGSTLTRDQAIKRWAFLFGPSAVAQVLSLGGGASLALGGLGTLISLAAFVYSLYLLYSASQDPKRQGFHDKQAGTVVVKRVG